MKLYSNNSITTNLTPLAGGSQSGAAQLNPGYNAINDAVNIYDSVQLPSAVAGSIVIGFVVGIQTNSIAVYAKNGTSDTINSELYETNNSVPYLFPIPPSVGNNQIFVAECVIDGVWRSNLVAGF